GQRQVGRLRGRRRRSAAPVGGEPRGRGGAAGVEDEPLFRRVDRPRARRRRRGALDRAHARRHARHRRATIEAEPRCQGQQRLHRAVTAEDRPFRTFVILSRHSFVSHTALSFFSQTASHSCVFFPFPFLFLCSSRLFLFFSSPTRLIDRFCFSTPRATIILCQDIISVL
ncbi:hypothetical protein HETIRDRAFT_386946, partial [Heterobasidion irregulare TC 32-1]